MTRQNEGDHTQHTLIPINRPVSGTQARKESLSYMHSSLCGCGEDDEECGVLSVIVALPPSDS